MTISRLRNVSLFVRDMERSLKVYRDILGLKVYFEEEFTDPEITGHLGVQGKKVRVVFLEADDSHSGMVALFDIIDEEALGDGVPPQEAHPSSIRTGNIAAVFHCSDLDGITARVQEAGCKLLHAPKTLKYKSYPPSREMIFWDPDGVLVNLIER